MLLLALTLLAAAPAQPPLVAVLELNVKAGNAELDRGYFSDRVRHAVLQARPDARLMTRDNIEVLARAAGVDLAACEADCAVDTGRKLGADYIVTGDVVRVGGSLKLSLRLHDTHDARLLSLAQAGGKTPEELDASLDRALDELVAPLRAAAPAPVVPHDTDGVKAAFFRDVLSAAVDKTFLHLHDGKPFGFALHVFGLELQRRTWEDFASNTALGTVGETVDSNATAWDVGLAPVTVTLPLTSYASLEWLQPYAHYVFGNVDSTGQTTGLTQSASFTGFRLGNRFALWVEPVHGFTVRAGVDVSFTNLSGNGFVSGNGLVVSGFAGLGFSLQ